MSEYDTAHVKHTCYTKNTHTEDEQRTSHSSSNTTTNTVKNKLTV